MIDRSRILGFASLLAISIGLGIPAFGHGDEEHDPQAMSAPSVDDMMEMHKGHSHAHDFEAIRRMSPDEVSRIMHAMMDLGLAIPPMNSHRGRELFVSKGCIVCHQVNGTGGEVGPPLNAKDMPSPMNAYEFAARMWRGAEAMIAMQRELFGSPVELNGQELLDLVAFAHDAGEQEELTEDQIPEEFKKMIAR